MHIKRAQCTNTMHYVQYGYWLNRHQLTKVILNTGTLL